MKFNPYAALLMTGALMFVTVILFQTGSSARLLKAGAASVDKDVSSFAAKTWTSLEGRAVFASADQHSAPRTRVASLEKQSPPGRSQN